MDPDLTEVFDELLEYLPKYGVLVCKKCRFAIQPSALSNHLKRHQLYRDRRKRLLDSIEQLTLAEPQDVLTPSPEAQPISALPLYNGYKCLIPDCGYNCASLKRIQSHESAHHGHPASLDVNCKQACLQTFFQGTQIKYFEVSPPTEATMNNNEHTAVRRSRGTAQYHSTPESLPDSSPSGYTISSALNLEDLRLMHQYTYETARTLHGGAEPNDFWVQQVPHLAMGCEHLMRGILAIAAAHLAFLEPCNSQEWTEIATRHHVECVSVFRNALDVPDNLNGNAAIAVSRLILIYRCADYQMRIFNPEDGIESSKTALSEHLKLTRGGCTMVNTAQARAKFYGSFSAFLPTNHEFAAIGKHNAALPFDIEMRFTELGNSLSPLIRSAGGIDPESFEAIHSALSALRASFRAMMLRSKIPSASSDAVDYWPAALSERYCNMVAEHHPIALVIFAHYCILLHWHGRDHWYLTSHAKFLLETIFSLLEEEQYLQLIYWPQKQIGV